MLLVNQFEFRLPPFLNCRWRQPMPTDMLVYARTIVTINRDTKADVRMTTNNGDGDSDPRSKMPTGLEHFDNVTDLEYLRKGIYIPTDGTDDERIAQMSAIYKAGVAGEDSIPRPDVIRMSKLNAHQLKKIASKFGYKNRSLTAKAHLLNAIYKSVISPHELEVLATEGANAKQRSLDEKGVVTNKIISTLFHPRFLPSFEILNNDKGHVEFDITLGPNNKFFWKDVIDCVNESDNDEEKVASKVLPAPEDCMNGDDYIKYIFAARNESPAIALSAPTTLAIGKEILAQLLAVRQLMEAMTVSRTQYPRKILC
jgi:hypothetical protein